MVFTIIRLVVKIVYLLINYEIILYNLNMINIIKYDKFIFLVGGLI